MAERGGDGQREGDVSAHRAKISSLPGAVAALIWHVPWRMTPDNAACHCDITAQTGRLRRGALRSAAQGDRGTEACPELHRDAEMVVIYGTEWGQNT